MSDPGQPQQAPSPDRPAGSKWVLTKEKALPLFDQHFPKTIQRRDDLQKLWKALIHRMDNNGTITASQEDLAEATIARQKTVHDRIQVLLGSGLLQLVQRGHGRGAAQYGVSDPGEPQQAPLPDLPEGSRWVLDQDEARALFDQHAYHIATTTERQRDDLRQLWDTLIDRMDNNGKITASGRTLAEATNTRQSTVQYRIQVLLGSGLLQLIQESHSSVAAQYGVSAPVQPQQAPLPDPPEGSRWVLDQDEARTLFDQHANHITATTQRQRDDLRQLWNALIHRMDNNGIITVSEGALGKATNIEQATVHTRIGALLDSGLLQLVQESYGPWPTQYGVSDPGEPRQAPSPGPALGPDRPQGEDLSRLDHGDTLPMPGPVRASSTDTGLPGLPAPPGLPGDPGIPTASSWQAGWRVPDIGMPDGSGAAIPANVYPPIGNQPDDGGNLDDWAAYQVNSADLLDLDPLQPWWVGPPTAMDTAPDPGQQPTDPTWPQAPTGPTSWSQPSGDQPGQFLETQSFPHGLDGQDPAPQSPMPGAASAFSADTGLPGLPGDPGIPTASSWQAGWRVPDIGMPDGSGAAIPANVYPPIGNQPDDGGNLDDWAAYQVNSADLLDLDPLQPWWVGPPTAMDTAPDPGQQPTDPTWPQAPTGPTSWSQPSGDQPGQFLETQSFPHGLDGQDPAPQSPMPGAASAFSADTGLPGLPGDPGIPTASSWQAGWRVPDIGMPDGSGAAIPANVYPPIGNQPDDGGNLDDWAAYQVNSADLLDLDPLQPWWVGPPTAMDTAPDPGQQPTDPTWPQAPTGPTSWSQPSGDQPGQFLETQSFPHGLDGQDPAPQSPMPGAASAFSADTGLPGLPGPLDDPDAPTASSWQAGWTEPGWPDPDSDVTTHGAAMSTNFGQPRNQAGEGSGNLGAWATHQGPVMDWQPSPAVTRTDAGTLHAGDTPHHPADELPTTAPLHPDQPQPQPQPTAGSRWARDPDGARALFDQHADRIRTQQREQLRQLWNALIDHMNDDGIITASEPDLATATSTPRQTVHNRIGVLRDRGLLRRVQESYGGVAARYEVSDPGQPGQVLLPALPEGSQWVLGPGAARALFDQHADHTRTQQRDQLRQLWNALIDHMNDDGTIAASLSDLATATSTPHQTVHNRIGALRDRGLLQLVQEARPGVAARYGVTDPGQPGQVLLPDLPDGSQWVLDREEARALFDQHADHIATTTQQQDQLRQLWNALLDHMNDDGTITASLSDLAAATSTPRPTVHDRIKVLLGSGLLQLVQEGHSRGAARYGVSDPGQPGQILLPALPAGGQWVLGPGAARALFDQHADRISTRQREHLRQLWNALIDQMNGDGTITASESDLAEVTSTLQPTVHRRIGALRDRGLLQLVQEAHRGGAARYGVSDPDQPRQASVPGPAPEPNRPQGGEDLSWLNHGDTSPMPGPAPASPAGTGLPGLLPGPLDAPYAPTASSWQAGWTEPGWPDPDIDVTTYGAEMSTDPGQPRDQADESSENLGAWATWQGPDMRFS
ncbi:hypothetical protein JD77_05953 [Micromonospora olivasterospora]|uniref:Uncharacterized protein n=1 Tax=Micromonospora olivasterospora TaxID=1880 RepID=A0A562IJ66_MICOL|nr:hypothetical protein JD77_05953 [Micromonospora olivasterospora]